ncbi:hypothetical protein [Celerinatantimonas diazotrophica]|uniref:LTXXQ motif family protein n=1 Tax=Celerinatantimonas diazotrophica TaxID=412034 RepID=A0A4R1J9F4_9GAMM|nr:hypothetical protein [Celerinatantimonas diazotrophica]TCK47054.1 hypothetical protein EV690_3208 [Celerinatantimonas diazotrophica]CAG9295822.1 hypothetical protein CEDIAZO_00949 [Celerinatantimonas diazotrophica]
MTSEQLASLLKLTSVQLDALKKVEARYIASSDELFSQDLSARQMYKQLRGISQQKHTSICQLLTPEQKEHYLQLTEQEHQKFKDNFKMKMGA